jgi:uncharacterized protein YjiS (DUF1127 family)
MDLLHRVRNGLTRKLSGYDTIHRLRQLSERGLADLGITRDEIRPVARLAARLDPSEADFPGIVARVRAGETTHHTGSGRLLAGVARAAARIATRELVVTEYQPREFDRIVADAHRARDAAVADLLRKAGSGIAAWAHSLAAPVIGWVASSETFRRYELARIRRAEHVRLRAQLESYSDRELMADLRLVRSEIDDVAAEGAQRLVDSVARDRRYRQATAWQNQTAS